VKEPDLNDTARYPSLSFEVIEQYRSDRITWLQEQVAMVDHVLEGASWGDVWMAKDRIDGDHDHAIATLQTNLESVVRERDHWRAEAADLEATAAELHVRIAELESSAPRRGIVASAWDALARCRMWL
jgi:hypothetical protein